MAANDPFLVPGEAEVEARERFEYGVTGLYRDLPLGTGTPLDMAAEYVSLAFYACANGNWQLCDALLAEGQGAAGASFLYLAEQVASPSYLYRVDSPHWDSFIAHLTVTVLEPTRPVPPSGPPAEQSHAETEDEFQARLARMVAAAEARHTGDKPRPTPPSPRPKSRPAGDPAEADSPPGSRAT
jgi:hypothetical protein